MKKKILIILNYYVPYISGVTEYARLAAEMLVEKGYDVTVLCSNHANLAPRETINGVKVVRAKVLFRISKGTVSTEYIRLARKLSKEADIVNLHLPMLESGIISKFVDPKKLATMYHCDVNLPPSPFNNFIVHVMDRMHSIALRRSRCIMVTSVDYAAHSRVASHYKDKLIGVIAPVKEFHPQPDPNRPQREIIGFCGRIVEEKGIDVLIKAFEIIKREKPDALLRIAGDYKSVAGGSVYPQLVDYIKKNHIKDVEFLGKLGEEELPKFFSNIDVFVLPSINSLEAFGMVQIEAMRCGAPVVASDLYGVRTIVQSTKAGVITHAGDAEDLAKGILEVLNHRETYVQALENLDTHYSNDIWGKKYLNALVKENG